MPPAALKVNRFACLRVRQTHRPCEATMGKWQLLPLRCIVPLCATFAGKTLLCTQKTQFQPAPSWQFCPRATALWGIIPHRVEKFVVTMHHVLHKRLRRRTTKALLQNRRDWKWQPTKSGVFKGWQILCTPTKKCRQDAMKMAWNFVCLS